MAARKETSSPFEINFSIVKVINNTIRHDTIYSEISDELSDFKNDNVQRTIQRTSKSNSVRGTTNKRPDRRRQEHSLYRKLADTNKHEVIYMLWKECMPQKIYRHVCKEKNILYLNGKNLLQPRGLEIITDFLKEDKDSYIELRNNPSSYKTIFQYVYSNVFPEIYCSTEKRGLDLKSNVYIIFKT